MAGGFKIILTDISIINVMKKIMFFSVIAGFISSIFGSCSHSSVTAAAEERDSTYTTLSQPDWSRNAVIYEVNWRQMTDEGNLTALTAHLPRLKELGADILWLMPIHPISVENRKGTLGSYYAVQDYQAVNPELGTMEQFKEFVKAAHDVGMKVIIDWVPNHTGCDHKWLTEHTDWYMLRDGKPYHEYDWTDIFKLNYENKELRRAMIDAMKYWITETDIDGFRCDVAGNVPTDFWDEARPELDAAKEGGVFMLAEAAKPELQKHAFNMGYNWPMSGLIGRIAAANGQNKRAAADADTTVHARCIDSLLTSQAAEYPRDTYMMNMITNHDMNSWEGTEFERLGKLTDAFAVLSFTLPGMPLIYTGQETGMDRALEFFEKDEPPVWEPRNAYFDFYRKLAELKHSQPALAAGEEGGEVHRYPTTAEDVYVFSREKDGSRVTVMVNIGAADSEVKFTGETPRIDGETVNFFTGESEEIPSVLAQGEYRVYVNNRR